MKKVLFIDHSYHEKTKSACFFVNLLKERFEVNTVYYNPYTNQYDKDDFEKKRYDILILWQIIFDRKKIDSLIDYSMGVLVPMYDSIVFQEDMNWYDYIDYKILCFSSTLFSKLKKWGFYVKYVQYYPKPCTVDNWGNIDSAFFWQRTNQLGLSKIEKLIESTSIKHLHVHQAVDPNNVREEVLNNNIEHSFSDWFENEDEMYNHMNKSAIYFAPREYEGIGMSFINAMANGRCVIAPNHPTMNEYIISGINGYLYDNDQEKLNISLDMIRTIQRNALQSVSNGHEIWINSKYVILDWIEEQKENEYLENPIVLYLLNEITVKEKYTYKFESYFNVLCHWIKQKQSGKSISAYLKRECISKIAIYGVGKFGKLFIEEFIQAGVSIEYLIDKHVKEYQDFKIYAPSFNLPYVDMIIVTTLYDYENIKTSLPDNYYVISIEKLIMNEMI